MNSRLVFFFKIIIVSFQNKGIISLITNLNVFVIKEIIPLFRKELIY